MYASRRFVRRWTVGTVAIVLITFVGKRQVNLWDKELKIPQEAPEFYSDSSSNVTHYTNNSSDLGQETSHYEWKRAIPTWLATADYPLLNSNNLEFVGTNQNMTSSTTRPGAFVHIGKTGGSTLSLLLRNGCHSFVRKPCREISGQIESHLSRLSTYYHVPDFYRLKRTKHLFYALTTRDPFERTVSAFAYLHPRNRQARNEAIRRKDKRFYIPCFLNLERFSLALGNKTSTNWCNMLAQQALNNGFQRHEHFFFDHKQIYLLLQQQPFFASAAVMVIRREFLWQDWVSANEWLGQQNVRTFPRVRERDDAGIALPVSKEISPEARKYLCQSLQQEYDVYFRLLLRSVNLQLKDLQASWKIAKQNCPDLKLLSEMRFTDPA